MVRIYINVSNINYSGYMNGKNCSSLLPEIFSFLIQTSFANSISNLSISLSLFIKYFFLLLFLHSQDDLFDTIHDNHVKIFSITNSKCNDKFSLNSHSTNSKRDQVFFLFDIFGKPDSCRWQSIHSNLISQFLAYILVQQHRTQMALIERCCHHYFTSKHLDHKGYR